MSNSRTKQPNPALRALFPANAFPAIVGTVHSEKCLATLGELNPGDVDLLEFRADAFLLSPGPALDNVRTTGLPWIFTLRDASQGGQCRLSASEKITTLQECSAGAAWIDVELTTARSEPDLLATLRTLEIPFILSHHDFETMPDVHALLEMRQEAADLGAGIFKVAAFACQSSRLHPLFRLLDTPPLPVSVMGMGLMGHPSRLALAIAGSVLNYGFLGGPNAPGQWYAPALKTAFHQALGTQD